MLTIHRVHVKRMPSSHRRKLRDCRPQHCYYRIGTTRIRGVGPGRSLMKTKQRMNTN